MHRTKYDVRLAGALEVAEPLIQAEKLPEQVYRLLRDRIVDGRLPPGSRIGIDGLVGELGVSKTPLREALLRLEQDQLVVTRPRSGTYVARPTRESIREVCGLRLGIEWAATRLATPAIPDTVLDALHTEIISAESGIAAGEFAPFFASDARLHSTIMTFSGNKRLSQTQLSIDGYTRWLRVLGSTGPHRPAGSSKRHLELVEAMCRRDPDAAAAVMAIHITEVQEWTLEDFERFAIGS